VGDIKRMVALMGLFFGAVFLGLATLLLFAAVSHTPLDKVAGAISPILAIPGGVISIYQLVNAKKTTTGTNS
jgi:hypothetical protein